MFKNRDASQLNEIESEFEGDTGAPISQVKVKAWMQSQDIEVLGAVYHLIIDKRYYLRIEPPLVVKDYLPFIKHYFERCFREIPQDSSDFKWAHSRYSAGWELASWFVNLWNDEGVPRSMLLEIKDWLAEIYKDGDEQLRVCIITATLEHLFETKEIARFFADWRKDLILRPGYDEAAKYSKHLRDKGHPRA
ncbi:MAG: hypothetical protein A2169_00475 [Deltaproteobacteria bacterium RBG_13_47_9]|nr:MAG: hypothetical protein A2169_00475 [Deltaproteobacteria bacterium RBG_13_47_9]